MIREWLAYMKCPSCGGSRLEYYKESQAVICPVCGWTTMADWNYVDMLGRKDDYETLSGTYADLFEKMEQGRFGDPEYCYSKTADEEFVEFLDETRLSADQIAGLRILDAGCGVARLTRMLSTSGARCVALDIHQRLYVYAKHKHRLPEGRAPLYIRGSVEDLPFEKPCFDVVWCQGVLSYVPDPVRAIQELQRVTKVGGYIYIWIYHTKRAGLLYRIARKVRTFPASVREPLYDLLAILQDGIIATKLLLKGKPRKKRQTKLHLRDWSIANEVNVMSLRDVLGLFVGDKWEVIWSSDEGAVVRCLTKKLR